MRINYKLILKFKSLIILKNYEEQSVATQAKRFAARGKNWQVLCLSGGIFFNEALR